MLGAALVITGILIAGYGWIQLLFGASGTIILPDDVNFLSERVVNMHALAIAQSVINLGYAFAVAGIAVAVIRERAKSDV